jgi:hypothetical protein
MKLKATFIFALFLITLSSSATKRSSAEIIKIAGQRLFAANTRAGSSDLKIFVEKDMLTIVGREDNGFVIVANDVNFPEVIGYSNERFSSMPPSMEWFMNTVDNNMQEMAKLGVLYAPIPPSSEFPESVEPFLKSTWDQGKPYNILCPGGNGSSTRLYPTGCVATALSQIMYYHKYPEVGIGEHQYSFKPESGVGRIISANFGETHYDWANMLDDYSKGYTDEQANAVATLMLHCGVAVEMGYTASGSGAYGQEACLGIKKFFGYNKNARLYTRDYYTAELWMEMIFKELNLKRPIYYDGVSEGGGGHAFIIDGYDKDGFVHVNWGWGGNSNGFFDIALLNPPGSSYSKAQGMILGMCKPDVDIPYESQVVATELGFIFSGTNTKRVTISGVIHNAGAEKFVGTIACVLENSENTIVLKKQEDLTLQAITGGMWYNTNFSLLSNNLSSIPDGTYRLFVGSKTAEDTRWQLVRPKEGEISSYTVVKNGTDVTWTESRDDRWTSTTTGISSVTIKPNDTVNPYIFDLQGRNQGNNINSLNKGIYIIGGKKIVR